MINLRYHIVSITAVFLALGIGLALGAAFIDTATVDTLDDQLTALERRVDEAEAENSRLRDELEIQEQLAEQGGEQLFEGQLEGVPVVVVAVHGVDEESLEATQNAIVAAGARFGGTLWITGRLALDGEDERQDLAGILNMSTDDPERLRAAATERLGRALLASTQPGEDGETSEGDAPVDVEPEAEPPLLTALRDAGFLEYEPPPVDPLLFAVIPAADARYLFVSGPGAVLDDEMVVLPLLAILTEEGPAPVVAAQAVEQDASGDAEPSRVGFVGSVREHAQLSTRVSTVDDLETFAGRVATVLALDHIADGQIGHYGIGDGAQSVVPQPIEDG